VSESELIWSPQEKSNSLLQQFFNETQSLHSGKDFSDLHAWSVHDSRKFWSELWDFCGVIGTKGSQENKESILPKAEYFENSQINLAENILRKMSSVTILKEGEDREMLEFNASEFTEFVSYLVQLFEKFNIHAGDSVVSVLPVGVEALAFTVAAFEISGVVSSASPEFGSEAIISRFTQLNPKALIICDSYSWNGKIFDRTELLPSLLKALPSLELVIVVSKQLNENRPDLNDPRIVTWDESPKSNIALEHERRDFNHPCYVLFTSGTTGMPKGLIHRTGGILLKHLVEQSLHCDMKKNDRVMFYTTTGWMMWNWSISVLMTGADLVLVDGSATYPNLLHLFHVAREQRLTHLGLSARLLDVMMKSDVSLADAGPFPNLRCLMITGSPLSSSTATWVSEQLGDQVQIAPFSGGTDIVGCFTGPNPLTNVYAGQMQGPFLGMDVDVWDEFGKSCPPNVVGELVCKKPFPSVPLGIIGDASGARFNSTYFEKWPGVWHHGDLASWTSEGGIIIHGRSDSTLNIGGVRIGTGEIYSALEKLEEVSDALAFSKPHDGDEQIVLLIIPNSSDFNKNESAELIKKTLKTLCSPRHVPSQIYFVTDLPRTFNGKLAEIAVTDLAHKRPIRNLSSLANPQALTEIAIMLGIKEQIN
jgi:acetoacetyl-CoA synthetase